MEQGRKPKSLSQKTMLSRALQKANTAVLLDNAQNFEGAMDAYADACHLLQQVMDGSTGDEDKRKLEAIRKTYTNRVKELQTIDLDFQKTEGKALPERPLSDDTLSPGPFTSSDGGEEALPAGIVDSAYSNAEPHQAHFLDASLIPPRRQSLLPLTSGPTDPVERPTLVPEKLHLEKWSNSGQQSELVDARSPELERPPAPLSVLPQKPSSPDIIPPRPLPASASAPNATTTDPTEAPMANHSRDPSDETTSWLDTIDESGGSSASSVRSRNPSIEIDGKTIHTSPNHAQADLNAAMDAAVEAAYDDNFDLAEEEMAEEDSETDVVLKAKRNVERARQKVREAEREDIVQGLRKAQHGRMSRKRDNSISLDYLNEEAEEEERLLEEMTKDYIMDDFQFGAQSKSALPHQPEPDVFSGRAWGPSHNSQTAAAAAASVAGMPDGVPGVNFQKAPPPYPPPAGALPVPPASVAAAPLPLIPSALPPRSPSPGASPGPCVRDRRLSGQNAKQLKIETNSQPCSGSSCKNNLPITTEVSPEDEDLAISTESAQARHTKAGPSPRPPVPQATPAPPLTPMTSVHSRSSLRSESPSTPAVVKAGTQDGDEPVPASPARFLGRSSLSAGLLRKNVSSSSLKMRNLSVATADASDMSPITPGSATFSINTDARKGITTSTPVMPTPTGNTFTDNGLQAGSMYLFDDQICSPTTPSSSGMTILNPPLPLEPCPESFLLRPFWLMRCLYQTIAHPRGGYLSTKLFVPRDVWRVKNVKIKGVEDKVAHCDLLTAALLRLAKADTLDADAVLEEMQNFETVLEQVRNNLQKRLGSEVGVQSSAALLKASPASEDAGTLADALPSKEGYAGNKSYLSSWRKLRSKSSGAGLTSSYTTLPSKEGKKEAPAMSSLPMTATPSSRPHKRSISQVEVTGPNAHYMGALARLFDAVQILDQIARQVEDPGLKHSSQTLVGLELSTRNAAEFFGFYVCRFALNDIGLMLDKFIKRGSEWVLA